MLGLGLVSLHRQNAVVLKFLKVRHFVPYRGNYLVFGVQEYDIPSHINVISY